MRETLRQYGNRTKNAQVDSRQLIGVLHNISANKKRAYIRVSVPPDLF